MPLLAVSGPNGKAAGTITKDRLLVLYKAYLHSGRGMLPADRDAFPKAVASLMTRYRDGRQTKDYHLQMQNYWTSPPHLIAAIRQGFQVEVERFACPLDFDPSIAAYYSPFSEDATFGAGHDAYSSKWLEIGRAHV